MSDFRRGYGAGPLHLLSAVAMGAIVLYALIRIAGRPQPVSFALWFGGAVLAHDMLAFPLYSALGLLAGRATAGAKPGAINYLRVPAFLSAVALLVWFPLILGLGSELYESKSGLSSDGYLAKWLLLTAALALGSALLYVVNARRAATGASRTTSGE